MAAQELEKVLPLIEEKYGANDTSLYTFLLVYTGVSFEKTYKYDKAEQYYLKAKAIYEKLNASSNTGYLTVINKLAGLSQSLGYYNKAETYYLLALEISIRIYGAQSPENVVLLNNFATLYKKMGNFRKAEPLYQNALEISKKAYGEEHPNTVSLLNNLGTFYDDIGNYRKAESIYLQTLNIRKKVPGIEHAEYAVSANNLGQLYFKMGNYEKAEPLYNQALLINKNVYGEGHINYAISLNNLGALYNNRGNYEKAELFYLESLEIRKKVLGERHPDYATSLNNLALFYQETGNYEKAEPLFIQASDIRLKSLGPEHPEYAVTLNNMALFYFETGNRDKAEVLLKQALNIQKGAFGEEHPDYAVSLNNMALFYKDLRKYDIAEKMFLQVLGINKKVLGEMNENYANALNNLAELYDYMGSYEKAENLYLQALSIIRKVYGEKHPDYTSMLSNLALLYQERGNYVKAEPLYKQAMELYLSQIQQQFSFLSEREKEKYLSTVLFFFKTYQNFIMLQYKNNPAAAGTAYDIELSFKRLVLNSSIQLRKYILNSGDSSAVNKYNSWLAVKASLARQYSLPVEEQSPETKMMEAMANDLEKQLSRIYSENNESRILENIHWQDVQKKLKKDEAAIEFTDFPFYNGNKWTDSTMYYAIILKQADPYPMIVPLFEGRQLDTILYRGMTSDQNFINELYRFVNTRNQSIAGKGRQLYDLIWKPVEKNLNGIRTLYFSPSGRLHQLSFAAIPFSETELLSDRYYLHQFSSTVQLTNNFNDKSVKNLVLFGGIDYDAGIDKMKITADQLLQPAEKYPSPDARSLRKENTRSGSWMYLDGTKSETDKIRKLAQDNGIKSTVITGNEATEESIKNLDGNSSPDVIHIATHGFFFPDLKNDFNKVSLTTGGELNSQSFRLSDNPLMRSGLVFAGANHTWAGEKIPSDLDDGILTAFEVSNMYLPNTELMVLSACETGLGEIKGSEGVFGLQRSFKIAGADYILMSLWQIPDYQTSELMNRFYSEWFSGKPIQESLSLAQDFMKNKYPLQPFMWAAFVLVR
jgi:tetratricopeptide (TPR) repeat protein